MLTIVFLHMLRQADFLDKILATLNTLVGPAVCVLHGMTLHICTVIELTATEVAHVLLSGQVTLDMTLGLGALGEGHGVLVAHSTGVSFAGGDA